MYFERYQHRLEWSERKENPAEAAKTCFNELFLDEFTRTNVSEPAEQALCRVEYEQDLDFTGDERDKKNALLKTPNNPFDSLIKKLPNAELLERYVLMYEEVLEMATTVYIRISLSRLVAKS